MSFPYLVGRLTPLPSHNHGNNVTNTMTIPTPPTNWTKLHVLTGKTKHIVEE